MIKIEHPVFPSPEQMDFIIEGMRNPMDSHKLSDSFKCTDTMRVKAAPQMAEIDADLSVLLGG